MNTDEEQIRTLVERWLEATENGELATILSLVDEDVRFLLPGRTPMDKQDFAYTQQAAAGFDFSIEHEIQEIEVSGDLAYCWNHLQVEINLTEQNRVLRRAGNVLSILRRRAGQWVIIRDANMLTEQDGES